MADNSYDDLFDADVFDMHGTRIGPVGQVYLDDQTKMATWITVKTGLFGLKETFTPLSRAIIERGKVTIPYDAQLVKGAPRVDPDKHLDAAEEAELYAHYGITNVMAVEPSMLDEPETAPVVDSATEAVIPVGEPGPVEEDAGMAPSRGMTGDPITSVGTTADAGAVGIPEAFVPDVSGSEPAASTGTGIGSDSLLDGPVAADSLTSEPLADGPLIEESLEETAVAIPTVTESLASEAPSTPIPATEATVRHSTIEKLTRAIDEIEDSLADDTTEHVAVEDSLADETAQRSAVEAHDYYNEAKED